MDTGDCFTVAYGTTKSNNGYFDKDLDWSIHKFTVCVGEGWRKGDYSVNNYKYRNKK
jgi:hypothetical protein